MKLSAYIITVDSGFAPHPFGRYCTLACCKPTIRRTAEPGDIVIACAASSAARPGHLVYAMRVKEVIPYQKYWRDARFDTRKPSKKRTATTGRALLNLRLPQGAIPTLTDFVRSSLLAEIRVRENEISVNPADLGELLNLLEGMTR